MKFERYQQFVLSKLKGDLDADTARIGFTAKLQEETGELIGAIAKTVTQGHP